MDSGINWKAVDSEMEFADVDDGRKSVYLGTVMSLSPSGKYYTPWANSNVEVCEACAAASDGPCDETSPCTGSTGDPLTGENHCEVCRDAAYWQLLEAEAHERGYYLSEGEGDPCDVLVCMTVETEESDE